MRPPQSSFTCCSAMYRTGTSRPSRIHDGFAEDALGLEDALRVMAKRAVPEVGIGLLGGIEPVMDWHVIGDAAAEQFDGAFRMEVRMGHWRLLNRCRSRSGSR